MVKKVSLLGTGCRENAIKNLLLHQGVIVNHYKEKQNFIDDVSVDFGIVCMEDYLCQGISEELRVPLFGPNKRSAIIEGSKIFSKNLMTELNIPTPKYKIFHSKDDAYEYIENMENGFVVKRVGLCQGKGVYVSSDFNDASMFIQKIPDEDFIIEEKLSGTEVSVMGFCNGKDIEMVPQIKDYKRIWDGNGGKNTGGMGVIGPVSILNHVQISLIRDHMRKIVKKLKFVGVLYAGLMINDDGFHFLEFNARLGDPETQIMVNLINSSLYDVMKKCIEGKKFQIQWKDRYCFGLVLSHIYYPDKKLDTVVPITLDPFLDSDVQVYWSGKGLETNGGRVATMVGISKDLHTARRMVYNNTSNISYEGKYFRRDIGLDYLLHRPRRKKKVAVLSSGNGTSIEALLQHQKIDLIITDRQGSIVEKGKKYRVKTFYLPQGNMEKEDYFSQLIDLIDMFSIDLILCVGYSKIIPDSFCHYYDGKLFNIHPSLLPDYGRLLDIDVHTKVLEGKEKISGCTIHKVTPDIDGGEIYHQKQTYIEGISVPQDLKRVIQKLEQEALSEFLVLMETEKETYQTSGVSISKNDMIVKMLEDDLIGSFCSVIEIPVVTEGRIRHTHMGFSCDGVGTKIELARKYNLWAGIGIDLVAMSVNDLIVRGIKPQVFLDYIASSRIEPSIVQKIIDSIKVGCRIAKVRLVGGETAEMPGIYRNKAIDLAGFSCGALLDQIYPKIDMITSGCKIYGIKSDGFHSNGYSLIRKILEEHHYDIHTLLKPTRIYNECFEYMSKYRDELLGMAHITGGGLTGNIQRILPSYLRPQIEIEIKNEFKWIMQKSGLNYQEMLSTFNCGYGMVLIFKPNTMVELDIIGMVV